VIDLVLATLGRTDEVARLLRSLADQAERDFRLIVVDQNPDDRLVPVLASGAKDFPILHLRSAPGNSRARNLGLDHCRGDVIAFPDDDCYYPPHLLSNVAEFLAAHPQCSGISGRSVDDRGRTSAGRWHRRPGRITRFNVWHRAGAYTVFLRDDAVAATGRFDEKLGLGPDAVWPAAEDVDYVLRAVDLGLTVHYDPELHVHHPQRREGVAAPDVDAGFRYGLGSGRVLRKNRLPAWFATYYIGRSFAASALSLLRLDRPRARFYWAVGTGRVRGWRSASTSS
jgi:glycosyltransferase involved in cell wall biosynthesis